MPGSLSASRASSYSHSVRTSPDAYGYSHIPTPDPPEPWAASIPPVTLPSTVSSPASSGPIPDYEYMATTMSTPSVDLAAVAPTSVPYQHSEVEYAENGVDSGGKGNRPKITLTYTHPHTPTRIYTQPYNTRPLSPMNLRGFSANAVCFRSWLSPPSNFESRPSRPVISDAQPPPTTTVGQYLW